MPIRSQAQRGAMYAAAAGNSTLGIPKKVGAEFVASDTGGKLPRHVPAQSKLALRAGGGTQQQTGSGVDYGAMVSRANKY
jgi:hypothetical protein